MKVEPLQKISISIYYTIPSYVGTAALYGGTTYIAAANQVKEKKLIAPAKLKLDVSGMTFYPIPYLTSVDVDNDNAYSVVMLGDSTLNNEVPLLLAENIKNGKKTWSSIIVAGGECTTYGNGALGTLTALPQTRWRRPLRQAGVAKIFVVGHDSISAQKACRMPPQATVLKIIAAMKTLSPVPRQGHKVL